MLGRRRSPHGERGLKLPFEIVEDVPQSRSPHGERGLKLSLGNLGSASIIVAPRMGSVG